MQFILIEKNITKCKTNRVTKLAIDKAKGIIAKPMPRSWHDRHVANRIEDDDTKRKYISITADKKPYFMRYIYPALMRQYNTYIKNTNRNSLREFQMTVPELMSIDRDDLTDRQEEFIKYYNKRLPVGVGDCVMNKICRKFEEEFDGYIKKHNETTSFDYTIMKRGSEYTAYQYNAIKKLYAEFNNRLRNYAVFANYERQDECESKMEISVMTEEFKKECSIICQNEETLCDIILDICYSKNSTKKFAWSVCAEQIIRNLLFANNETISYPTMSPDGDIEFCGERFVIAEKKFEVNE